MTITLDLKPEVEAELVRQAAAQGRAIEDVAAALLEGAVQVGNGQEHNASARAAEAKDLMELSASVRGLLTDDEVDTLFARNPSLARPLDLS